VQRLLRPARIGTRGNAVAGGSGSAGDRNDAYTLDRPFTSMTADFRRTGDGRYIWPAHFAGITREYCQIEKLANLDQVPAPAGFRVSCFPVKIEGAGAGWCRAVAIVG